MTRHRPERIFERPPRYEDEPPQPYWPSFAEKLLLALIDAHSVNHSSGKELAEDSDRQGRLNDALNALFLVPRPRGKRETYKLHALMAGGRAVFDQASAAFESEVLNWPKSKQTRFKSKRRSADSASPLVKGNSLASSSELVRKSERNVRDYLTQIALLNSHQEEEDMMSDLRAIQQILARWNIALHVDSEALGMASQWERNPAD